MNKHILTAIGVVITIIIMYLITAIFNSPALFTNILAGVLIFLAVVGSIFESDLKNGGSM